MTLLIEKYTLDYLKKKIKALHILDPRSYSDLFLSRRIFFRMNDLGLTSPLDYVQLLKKDNKEREALFNELTIQVSNFFRNRAAYDTFLASALMELLKQKQENKQQSILIWSAGCSSGEEPYSIAIMLFELLQYRLEEFKITILATDISKEAIAESKNGIYTREEVKEAPPDYIPKYFDRRDELYVIKEHIKRMVHFEVADILTSAKPVGIDILFCRNTLIYFNKEMKEKMYEDFAACLRKGGYLVLGMTESITGTAKEKFEAVSNTYRIYKKK